jgi:hypothetical protein
VLTAAGALKSAVLLLRKCKLPDCTAAYVEAATRAGFGSQSANSETGETRSVLSCTTFADWTLSPYRNSETHPLCAEGVGNAPLILYEEKYTSPDFSISIQVLL